MAKELNRYDFTGVISNMFTLIRDQLANDPNWNALYSTNYDANFARQSSNIRLVSKLTPAELHFTMCLNYWSYNYYLHFGLQDNTAAKGTDAYADIYANLDWLSGMPFSHNSANYNVSYNFTVFTNEDFVYIHGEPTSNPSYASPIHIYLGRLTPHEVEDPTIAKDFVGVFHAYPMGISSADYGSAGRYHAGRGVVRKSRNGTKYTYYNFTSLANLTSPGAGDTYYVSPFYVWAQNEGVRGEFTGMRTSVLKDVSAHPDGSILDLGTDKYHIFFVKDGNPITITDTSYMNGNSGRVAQPQFFPSQKVFGNGQRVLLFKI